MFEIIGKFNGKEQVIGFADTKTEVQYLIREYKQEYKGWAIFYREIQDDQE